MSTRSGVGRQVRASREGSAETIPEAHLAGGGRDRCQGSVSLRPSRGGHWGALGDVATVSVWPRTTALSLDRLVSWLLLVSDLQAREHWAGEKQSRTICPRPQSSVVLGLPRLGLLSGAEHSVSCRDGAPYCEKDYQGLFGVKCEACHQFITGKVLEVSDGRAALKAPFPSEALGHA